MNSTHILASTSLCFILFFITFAKPVSGELKELKREEVDINELKELVAKEEKKSISPESHDMTKDEVLKTILEMAPWGEMHEELKNEEMTPMSKEKVYILQLNKEMGAAIVKQKEEKIKNMIVNDYVPKFLIEHNYRFLGTHGGGNYHSLCGSMSQDGL